MRNLARQLSGCFVVAAVLAAGTSPLLAQEDGEASEQVNAEEAAADEGDQTQGPPPEVAREKIEAQMKLASRTTGGISPSMSDDLAKLRKIKKKLEQEPSIDEVQKAALQFYGIERGTISGYGKAAKSKALAPKVTVQYRKNKIDTSIDKFDFVQLPDEVAGRDDIAGDVDEFVVGGTWNLPKLVYNPEVLELASLRKLRERVLKEVTRLYYLRRRLKIGFMLNPPEDASTRARKQIRIDQTTAMINAITNGVFEGNQVE